jgi:mRNA-degrading endonuclease RelE of RelBE toxin-antitoxin system
MYQVVVSKSAEKELIKLPTSVIKKIVPVLQSLAENPDQLDAKN